VGAEAHVFLAQADARGPAQGLGRGAGGGHVADVGLGAAQFWRSVQGVVDRAAEA